MNFQDIFYFFLLGIGLLIIILFIKKKKIMAIVLLSIIGFFAFIAIITNIPSLNSDNSDWIGDHQINNINLNDSLSIRTIDGKKQLYNDTLNESIQFKNLDFKFLQPVFLSQVDNYYVVVFSLDGNKTYEDGRFYQGDLELQKSMDKLAFIDVEHAYIHELRKVELIGRTIDLFSMDSNDTSVAYKVYHYYSDLTFAYYFTTFSYAEKISLSQTYSITLEAGIYFYPMVQGHETEGAIQDNVTNFGWANDNYCIFNTEEGVKVGHFDIETYISDGFITGSSWRYNDLTFYDSEIYLQQGYYTVRHNLIYYVDNNMNLYELRGAGVLGPITDLEHWTDSIPE